GLAELAAQSGDLRAEILARLETAMFALPASGDTGAAVRAVEALVPRVASAASALRARVLLTLAQVRHRHGALAEARAACRALMRLDGGAQEFPRELGRAALLLGALEAEHQPKQARKHLALARTTARDTDDWQLLAQVVLLTLTPEHAPALLAEARPIAGEDW